MAHIVTPRRDRRWIALAVTVGVIAAGGGLVHFLNQAQRTGTQAPPAREQEVRTRFDQAVAMLHAKQYDHAVTALHRVLELAPQMPEAHVNMGFALLGLKRAPAARDFFETASQLNPMQANAYYGSAMAFEELGDLPAAVGAMRTYLHLARQEDERHLAKARAALWEWEAQLAAQRAAAKPAPKSAAPAGK
jgi:tetratricopeptide (TPR) repeat protein